MTAPKPHGMPQGRAVRPVTGSLGAQSGNVASACTDAPSGSQGAITITLALPSKACLPNVRANRYAKIAATEQDRTDACYTALQAVVTEIGYSPHWAVASATVQFRFPNRIRRDTSNYFAGMKPQWDGLVDAGVLLDDEMVVWHIPLPVVDRANPGVEITIREGAE